MIKVLKWVYKLGYNKAMENVFNTLDKEYMFHSTQSQIKSLKDIKPSDDWLNVRRPRTTILADCRHTNKA